VLLLILVFFAMLLFVFALCLVPNVACVLELSRMVSSSCSYKNTRHVTHIVKTGYVSINYQSMTCYVSINYQSMTCYVSINYQFMTCYVSINYQSIIGSNYL
jgi:hypothetical protein